MQTIPYMTTGEAIRHFQRRADEIECILKRRDQFIEAIDWSAITKADRDRVLYREIEDLHMEMWDIDIQLYARIRRETIYD